MRDGQPFGIHEIANQFHHRSLTIAAFATFCLAPTSVGAGGRDYQIHLGAQIPSLCALRDLAHMSPVLEAETIEGQETSTLLFSGFVIICNVPGAISLVRVRDQRQPVRISGAREASAATAGSEQRQAVAAALQGAGPRPSFGARSEPAGDVWDAVELGQIALSKGRATGAMATGGDLTVMALGGQRIESESVSAGDEVRVFVSGRQ